MENASDYADILRLGGLVCAGLWPVYGLFCHYVLGLAENFPARLLVGLGYLGLWYKTRKGPIGKLGAVVWTIINTLGMIWLPVYLYLHSNRSDYWQMSIIFFALALGLAVRGWDLFLGMIVGSAVIIWQFHQEFKTGDIILVPVAAITLWVAFLGVHALRSARRRIQEQAEEILRQNQILKNLDRRKDEFTASIAHDLRTPLAVAMSLSEDLSDSDLSPISRRRLESLIEALRQMKRQSEDLLDLERFNLGVARIDPVVLDLCSWLRRFEEGFTSMARARGISFQIVLVERQLVAKFDPIRLEAALFNLVSNAFKFTPPDGHVEVHLRRMGPKSVGIAVLDDGEGIPMEALPRIFDRYEQVDRGPGTYTAGVGIGLALVREIAEIHGGKVRVQSTLGLGSLFEILLDNILVDTQPTLFDPSPTVEIGPLVNLNRAQPSSGMILVVEDQQLLRHVLRDILENVSRVATARDGHEALRLVHELRPDLIVTDLSMPGMNGLDLLAALRSTPESSDIPVLILSGDVATLRTRLAHEPRLTLMSKPFEQAKLLAAVGDLLKLVKTDSDF